MTPRRKRMITVVAILAGVGIATAFALQSFQKNLLYYYSPSQIQAGEAPSTRSFRVGGLVENGSLKREPGSLEVRFIADRLCAPAERQLHGRAAGPVPRRPGRHCTRQDGV